MQSGGAESAGDDRSTTAMCDVSGDSEPVTDGGGTLDPLWLSQRHVSSRTLVRMYVRPSVDNDSASCVNPAIRVFIACWLASQP